MDQTDPTPVEDLTFRKRLKFRGIEVDLVARLFFSEDRIVAVRSLRLFERKPINTVSTGPKDFHLDLDSAEVAK